MATIVSSVPHRGHDYSVVTGTCRRCGANACDFDKPCPYQAPIVREPETLTDYDLHLLADDGCPHHHL